ncbi:excisionase family DNA-binding protein [Patescibacteria group bacterium]|nr:excisionase family DNA-binding protein [Patescibacteria group bacterium]
MNEETKLPELLTLSQTAEILSVHKNTLRKWDKKGILKAVRFGERGDRRFKKEDVMKLMEKSD